MRVNDHGARAAAVLAVILMLAACNSSTPTAPGSRRSGTAPSPAASLSARLTFSGGQETARMGRYTQVFATPLPANPAQARVIRDFRTAQILWGESNEALHPVAPVLAYVTGIAQEHLMAALASGREFDQVPAGTERFFLTRVAALSASRATVTTCDDASKFRQQNPRTGRPYPKAPPDQQYLFESWQLAPRSGHWAIVAFSLAVLPNSQALPCQP
jgi:hypothetical protein